MTATFSNPDLVLEFEARPDVLRAIRSDLAAWCERAGIESAQTGQICLAVDEAITNIIRHAYAGRGGPIRLRCARQAGSLLITLDDDGTQVPLQTIRPRDLGDVKPGGLGVHLIQQVMDEAVWSHKPGGGTTLTMRVTSNASPTQRSKKDSAHA